MIVKVLIERAVDPGNEEKLQGLLSELRSRAVRQHGYVTGETLFSVDRPGTHLVISTWRSLRDWQAWQKSKQRKEMTDRIDPLLVSPEKVSAWGVSPPALEHGA